MSSRFPLGLSTFTLASPFSDADLHHFGRLREIGYEVVEVCLEDPAVLSAGAVAKAAAAEGLAVTTCGAFGHGRDVSHEDAEVRRSAAGYLRTCIDFAAGVGSPIVAGPMYATTGRTRLLPDAERAEQRRRAADGLAAAAAQAAAAGVTLAIEPLNRFETDLVNTVEQGLALCELIGAANVGLLLDTFHMHIEETDTPAAIRRAGDRLVHVQASENHRGTPGDGQVDWPGVAAALRDVGYRGPVVVESFLPTVAEIARAVSLWRPVAESMDVLARDGHAFLSDLLNEGND